VLNDEQIESIRKTHGRVGVVDYDGHRLVFRRPSRDEIRDYRRKQDSAAEKPDCLDQLAQQTLAAFDDVTDPMQARVAFLAFLDSFPAFTSCGKFLAVSSVLSGMVEAEAAEALGKGASVRGAPPPSTPTA